MLTISVRKLDGDVINITTDKKEKGEFVFDKVCESIDLVEKDYFGLQYEDKTGVTNWLDLSRRLGRLIKSDNAEFQFAVKFYPPDPSQLQEDVTRYQLCLQIRNDILSEKLLCSFVTYALLGSYLVQSELGDYSPEEYPDSSYLKNFRFSPEQTPELESKVMELHRTHKGQTPAEAELHYLENAKKLAMYGVDFHPAKDSEGVDITLGVCSTGLLVYRERLRINRFAWPKILKISYKRNYFYVKIRPGDYEPYENTVVFKLESHKAAKRLWNVCVEHHTFFRLMTPEDVARPGLIPGLSNKFPSLRKTHYQTKRNTIEREPPSSFRKSQRYPTSKSMDPLQPSNKEKDAKKRHTMPPENTQSPRKEKRIPGAVPVLPMADFKKKDQKENGVTNESDEEKENRNLKENREEDKKKKSSGLGLFKRSEGKRDKLEEIGAKREYEYEYEEDTKKSPKGVSKGFSYERSSSKEGSQPSSPDKDPTKSPTKARTFAFNYAPETPESDKKSGFSSLFSKRKKKDETSETTPKTDEKRESPLAAFLPGKDKKSKVSLFKDKSKESPAKDSPSKDTSFKDNESPATDAKTKDKDSKSKDKSKSKDSKESPSKDDSPTKDKKDSLVRGLFKDSSKDKDSPKKDSSKDKDSLKKDSSKKDSAKDKDSTAEKDSLKKGSTIDKDSAKNDSTKNLSKDSLLNDKDSKEKSKDKDSKDKSKDSKDKAKDSKDKAKDKDSKDKDSKDKAKDKDSKDKVKDKDSKDKVKDKDSKDKTKDSKDKSKDSKDKAKDKDSKDKSKDKDSKEKVKDKDSKDKAKDDSKDVSSDLDLSKESAGKDSSSKDKDSLTKEKEDAKKDKSAAKSGFFGFKDKKKDSETFIGEERSPKGGLFGWRKTPTKKDEENDENKPKVVKTTTKQSVVKEGSNVTRNIEEKIEDLATGDVTLNTAESLLEDQGSSPYVTATAVTTRTAMTTEDIGKNEKTSQVEEKTVARTTTTSGTRQEQRVVTQEVRATTVVSEPQERRSSISSTSSDDSGTPIDGDVAPYYAVAPHQEPIVETEAVFLTPGTGVAPQTTATPFVSTSTNLIGPVASDTVVSGEIVSSQTITSKTRTVETVTYKTEKDGVVETRVEQKITIQSDGDPIDHDKALQEAIQEATAMNPDMQVEKIEIQQESLDQ